MLLLELKGVDVMDSKKAKREGEIRRNNSRNFIGAPIPLIELETEWERPVRVHEPEDYNAGPGHPYMKVHFLS